MPEQIKKPPIKNYCLAFFEVLACCLIVFIHIHPPGNVGFFMQSIGRFGVPLFFAISGFFLYKEGITKDEARSKLKKKIFHIALMLLWTFLFYLCFRIVIAAAKNGGEGIQKFFAAEFSWRDLIYLLIFNHPFVNNPSWFLVAMLCAYIFIYIFPNLVLNTKWFPYFATSLLLVWLIFRLTMILTKPTVFELKLTTPFIYLSWFNNGLPFMCLGILLKRWQEKIKQIPFKIAVIAVIVSTVSMVAEMFLMKFILGQNTSYCIGNILCVISMFAVALQKPSAFSNLKVLNLKGQWTTFVYILHPAVITLVKLFFGVIKFTNTLSKWRIPFVVLILSVLAAIGYASLLYLIKKKIKQHKESKSLNQI